MSDDQYSLAVPFYDLWHEDGHVPEIRELLPPLLKGVRRSVMEIGAGTGLITELIVRETTADVYAVEPALAMRSVLLSRVAANEEARRRVTVLPYGALDVDVDEPVEAIVMISVLQAFPAARREELWRVLARQLQPGGLLLFNWRERPAPTPGELELMGAYQVGRHTYEVWGQVVEVAGETVRSRFLYRVRQRGVVIGEDEVTSEAHRPGGERLAAELAAAGFARDEAPDGLAAWRRTA
ncbi:class I SAM-dependent methyltransferase [Nonomuraea sp. WAC 01424]|uniref:class I SAM-dependent methyltransferase n=1 Tax=Nonomuraea sp. WAC 01424 TaxID=2203200 RepID=UPI000F7A5A31|nr:class I SAM-dependent methyltransferase [Nonomuraea sp. WAC 01424]RSN12712.1 class I SAM-dependent methyltransferase [Nonomuraea sp. WAC 01424]